MRRQPRDFSADRNPRWPVSLKDRLRGCLGTHFRNSLKIGRLDKINPLF
ncbi:MAG: hypothetical protein [Olavius algarvensis Gamma 1 endosymbiont]|nr:MAG: hypothetical protein [Olavius algarvensis Gamma 1 endosymbiont]